MNQNFMTVDDVMTVMQNIEETGNDLTDQDAAAQVTTALDRSWMASSEVIEDACWRLGITSPDIYWKTVSN
tara:strand:- start:95 stop:307 length:213 start_codon:yes stop_codon:yes gene_type:complete